MTKFAVIKTGGKQYRIVEGDVIRVESLGSIPDKKVVFSEVLLIDDGQATQIGDPFLKGATVEALVVGEGKAKKVTVMKYKPKVRYRKVAGHRQLYTEVKITKIGS